MLRISESPGDRSAPNHHCWLDLTTAGGPLPAVPQLLTGDPTLGDSDFHKIELIVT